MRPAQRTLLVLLFGIFACGEPERSAELRKELAQLKTERVERAAVSKAQTEVLELEARLEAMRQQNTERAEALGVLARRRDGLRINAAAERARAVRLVAEGTLALEQTKQAGEAAQELEQRISKAQSRARLARDQVTVFARELRPEDPAWATERRLASLRELVIRLEKEWAGDPVLAEAAAELRAAGPSGTEAASASRIAMRLGSRFTAVYDLPRIDVAGAPPETPGPGAGMEEKTGGD
jgi:hypothetical protein